MKHRLVYALLALFVVSSMVLAACQPAATEAPTTAPGVEPTTAPTTAPATDVPTVEVPAGRNYYVEMAVSAPSCDYGGEFSSIETIDEFTVKFTLCYPDPDFPSKVAFSVFSITDKEFLDANSGDSVKMSEAPNGSGPYMLKEWIRGDRVIYEANPTYWGTPPAIPNLVFRWSEQSAQRLLELQSGEVDGIDNPAPEDFATIEGDANLALYARPPLNIFYIGFNHNVAPFDDVKVRQAIAYAIDRERIVDQYYPEGSSVAKVFVPPSIQPGYSDAVDWYPYDPEMAKTLLAEANQENLEIELSIRNVVRAYLPTPDKVAQEIQAQLAEVGITVTINVMESTAFIDATAAGEKGFYLLGWNADYPGATNFYDYHFAASGNQQFGDLYEEIVTEIRAAGQVSDPVVRQQHYDAVNTLLKDNVVMIPVAHGASATAFKASIEGAHASPLGNEVMGVLSSDADQFVWMQNGEPSTLWCIDETDGETLRACEQIFEALLSFKVGGAEVEPGLAESYVANDDATEWTFTLRQGVQFQDGSMLDASDVVASYAAVWDAKSPNHVGRTGNFEYFTAFFNKFLNAE
ncbi:MAG TPA: ABC transporter substrate-binding protein [Bellilinea sp.]